MGPQAFWLLVPFPTSAVPWHTVQLASLARSKEFDHWPSFRLPAAAAFVCNDGRPSRESCPLTLGQLTCFAPFAIIQLYSDCRTEKSP